MLAEKCPDVVAGTVLSAAANCETWIARESVLRALEALCGTALLEKLQTVPGLAAAIADACGALQFPILAYRAFVLSATLGVVDNMQQHVVDALAAGSPAAMGACVYISK